MRRGNWWGLYSAGWGKRLVPEAYQHPAKGSYGLAERIYQYAFERGWITESMVVLDPFGGIGGFCLHAMMAGCYWVGVELEQPFCDTGLGCDCTGISKADWVRFQGRWEKARYLEGRYWCPRCLADAKRVLDAPPQASLFDVPAPTTSYVRNSRRIPETGPHHYKGNIETWRELGMPGTAIMLQGDSRKLREIVGRVGAIVSSPPWQTQLASHDNFSAPNDTRGWMNTDWNAYGTNPSNLGNMPAGDVDAVIASPPHQDTLKGGEGPGARYDFVTHSPGNAIKQTCLPDYGANSANLGNLPAGGFDAVVSSSPWEDSVQKGRQPSDKLVFGNARYGYKDRVTEMITDYGDTEGNIGNETGDTFWSAAKTILAETFAVLKPDGVAIWVCKRFVRNKQMVQFPEQWAQLCESVGFERLEWIRAWLVEDRGAQWTLENGLETRTVERKSFFRRLAEKKGSPRIDWEDVIVMRKPDGEGGGVDAVCSSPPFGMSDNRGGTKMPDGYFEQVGGMRTTDDISDFVPGNLGNLPATEDDWQTVTEQE